MDHTQRFTYKSHLYLLSIEFYKRNFESFFFFRLQERFIKPSSSGGPCPEPSFPGCQEFFHNFIIAASCPVFNQHLSNTFVGKVSEVKVVEIDIYYC